VRRQITVLFSDMPDWEPEIRDRLDDTYALTFAAFDQQDVAAFDVVVPLRTADTERLTHRFRSGRGVNALFPTAEVLARCEDKLAFNTWLVANGFGQHVPRMTGPFAYPHLVKARRGQWGEGIEIIHDAIEDEAYWASVDPEASFRQEYVLGRIEQATHLLVRSGEICFRRHVEFVFDDQVHVKGLRARQWVQREADLDEHLPLLATIVAKLGYEGTCCFGYKVVKGHPWIFELNARFGASLSPFVADYLRALVVEVVTNQA
jgi:carbamoylphosphate synthase large subunit